MKFIADDMLGRLAKWLRILGYDTLYYPRISDSELLRQANAENRIILTRDTHLVPRVVVGRILLIKYDNIWQQLQQVIAELNLDLERFLMSRCSICNCEVVEMDKEAVRGKVPEYVIQTQSSFSQCPQCGRVYWRGSHYFRIKQRLALIKGEGSEG